MRILIVLLALGLASPALGDWETAPGQIVLLSDEIFGNSVNVTRPSDSAPGNDKNKSGMGDSTNPGQGSGIANSPNEGTDNPNNSGN